MAWGRAGCWLCPVPWAMLMCAFKPLGTQGLSTHTPVGGHLMRHSRVGEQIHARPSSVLQHWGQLFHSSIGSSIQKGPPGPESDLLCSRHVPRVWPNVAPRM